MPDYPVFQPAAAPGSGMTSALAGLDAGQSYMDRASRLRMAQETHGLQMQQEEMLRPAREAQARATVAAANNQVSALKQTEDMRAIAHTDMPGLRDEWSQASMVDDPGERVRAMTNVLGRASKYESVGELKPEIDVWKNVLANQAVTERTLAAVDAKLQNAKDLETAKAQHAQELQAAKDAAKADVEAAKAESAALRKQLDVQGRKDVAGISAGARTEAATIAAGSRVDAAKARSGHLFEREKLIQRRRESEDLARDAESAGESELAARYRQESQDFQSSLNKLNHITLSSTEEMDRKISEEEKKKAAPATPPPKPAPKPSGTDPFKNVKF